MHLDPPSHAAAFRAVCSAASFFFDSSLALFCSARAFSSAATFSLASSSFQAFSSATLSSAARFAAASLSPSAFALAAASTSALLSALLPRPLASPSLHSNASLLFLLSLRPPSGLLFFSSSLSPLCLFISGCLLGLLRASQVLSEASPSPQPPLQIWPLFETDPSTPFSSLGPPLTVVW